MQDPTNLRRIDLKTEIHPTAVVHPWAKIGVGVKIGPYCVIGEHAEIGDGCELGSHIVIEGRTRIGKFNQIYHGASIGTPPQDLKFAGGVSYLEIGSYNIIREYVTINRATGRGERTKVGSNCFLMAYAHVAHNCELGDHVVMANSVNLAGHVRIDDYAIIGGVTPVHQFVRIGQHAFVGGGSRVERDIPPYIKAAGSPTKVYGINTVGLERRGFSQERRAMIKQMFNMLYRTDLNVSQVTEKLKNGDFVDPERSVMVEFLESCERGINK